jgi:hypothetical protein
MSNFYKFNSIQAKKYSFKEYTDRVVMLKTGKAKKQVSRIIKMSKYIEKHESEENLWFKRFGILLSKRTEEERYSKAA